MARPKRHRFEPSTVMGKGPALAPRNVKRRPAASGKARNSSKECTTRGVAVNDSVHLVYNNSFVGFMVIITIVFHGVINQVITCGPHIVGIGICMYSYHGKTEVEEL